VQRELHLFHLLSSPVTVAHPDSSRPPPPPPAIHIFPPFIRFSSRFAPRDALVCILSRGEPARTNERSIDCQRQNVTLRDTTRTTGLTRFEFTIINYSGAMGRIKRPVKIIGAASSIATDSICQISQSMRALDNRESCRADSLVRAGFRIPKTPVIRVRSNDSTD